MSEDLATTLSGGLYFNSLKKKSVTLSVYRKHISPLNVQIHGNDNGPVIFIFLKVAVMEKGKLLWLTRNWGQHTATSYVMMREFLA